MTAWDRIFEKKGKVFRRPNRDVVEISKIFKEKGVRKILDIGCGTGRHLVYLSKQGFKMFGFDSSPEALSISEKWLNDKNQKAKLTLCRIEDKFPYEDNYFDAAISTQLLHHNLVEDILKTISEIERVLTPQGFLFISVPVLTEDSKFHICKLEKVEKNTYMPTVGPEKELIHHFFTQEEIPVFFNNFIILKNYIGKTKYRYLLM